MDILNKINDIKQFLLKANDLFKIIKCPICDFKQNGSRFKQKISKCICNQEFLLRYECPNCGVIFGNHRMLNLSKEKLAQEYEDLYKSGYKECDSTDSELEAFYALNPQKDKDKIYLNYGSGAWSNSIEIAQNSGYNFVGFEPYSNKSDDPNIITDIEKLKQYKFDGIISHNLIEHLQNPIEVIAFLKTLLKNENSFMVHFTPCYDYVFEYSRFHLFFFTGSSLSVICKKTGLEYIDTDKKELKIFKIKNKTMEKKCIDTQYINPV